MAEYETNLDHKLITLKLFYVLPLILLIIAKQTTAGYQECMNNPDHVVFENYCYLVLPSKLVFDEAEQACGNTGGYLAVVNNLTLSETLLTKTSAPDAFIHMGLHQRDDATSPKTGWHWHKGGKSWDASYLLAENMWHSPPNFVPEPNDGYRDGQELNRENHAATYRVLNSFYTHGRFVDAPSSLPAHPVCQYDVPRKKFVPMAEKSAGQGVIELSTIDSNMDCCSLCWESPLCQSFTFNSATNSCSLHRFFADNPSLAVVDDPNSTLYTRSPDSEEIEVD